MILSIKLELKHQNYLTKLETMVKNFQLKRNQLEISYKNKGNKQNILN